MDEITPKNSVGIQAQIVVRLPFRRRPRDWSNARSNVEDRHQRWFVLKAIAQALLIGSNAFVPVDVETDDVDTAPIEPVKGFAEQSVVNRPAKALNVAFFDTDQCDGCVAARGCRSLRGDQVIDQQIDRLR